MSRHERHIVILGPMGVGKTTVGTIVADALGWTLVDSDRVIEALHGQTGRDIAADEGVDRLHRIEGEVFEEAIGFAPPSVIAAAASVADQPALLGLLDAPNVIAALLTADPDVVIARSQLEGHRRPIDGADVRDLMTKRMKAVVPFADVQIDVTKTVPEDAARRIIDHVRGGR